MAPRNPNTNPVTESPTGASHDPRAGEREAVHAALHGGAGERVRIVVESLATLLRDPDDTHQVFRIGLVLGRIDYPRFITRFTLDDEGARLLRDRPAIDRASVDFDWLRSLPATTFGGAYARFLDERGLTPDLFRAPEGLPEVPGYISQRMRQVHDLWHVLTGFGTDVAGEVAVLAFTYAQTRGIAPLTISAAATMKFGRANPGMLRGALRGFRMGKAARYLPTIRLEDHFERPLDEVRREWNIVPVAA